MKEQIEEILREYWNDEAHDFALKKARTAILKLSPNNDWLEYPKHKPSEQGIYVVATKNNDVKFYNLQYGFNDQGKAILEFKDHIIAFKPIPVEPFKPKNKYVKLLDGFITNKFKIFDNDAIEIMQELKTKIENGDLK